MAGSVRIEAVAFAGESETDQVLWQWDDGTESNRLRIVRGVDRVLRFVVTAGAAEQANINLGVVSLGAYFEVWASWRANDFAAQINGRLPLTDTSGSLPTGLTTVRWGRDSNDLAWRGAIRKVSEWDQYVHLQGVALSAEIESLADYGIWRGDWNLTYIALTFSPFFSDGDIVRYGGGYWYCILSYTAISGGPTPDLDQTHWQPLPIFAEVVMASDDFASGSWTNRVTPVGGYSWLVTGAGNVNAVVQDGYASSSGNTYFVLSGLPSPPSTFIVNAEDKVAVRCTLAQGGDPPDEPDIFAHMLHVNFEPQVTPLYWLGAAVGENFNATRLYARVDGETGLVLNVAYDLEVRVRGKFMFAYVDGVLRRTLCDDLVLTLMGNADSVYTQVHREEAVGNERIYSVTVKRQV